MVTKTKRALALILTGMMAATALAGCGQTSPNVTPSASTPAASGSTSTSDGESQQGASDVAVTDIEDAGTIETLKSAMADEASANGGTIKLEVWCSSDDGKFEKTLVKSFKEKYNDSRYKFDISVKTSYGEDKAGSKIMESPKDGADVFNFADDQLSTLVQGKAIAEIGQLFQGNVKANNTEDSVAVCSIDGTAYAFPKTSDNGYFMYYDKRVFKTEEDVAELDKMIETANAAGKNVFISLGNGWYNAGFYFAAGCTISYDSATKKQTASFNTPEGLNAAKAMCHVSQKVGSGFMGSAGQSGENATVQQGFSDGTMAAAVIGTWMGPAIKKAIGEENVGAAKLPTALIGDQQVQLHSFGGYKIVGVNAFTKFPIAAQTLAYYLTNADSQKARYAERGLIPTNKAAVESDEIKNDPALKAINDQKPYAHAQGQSVSSKFWSANVGGFGGDIVTARGNMSDADLQKGLQDLVTQIESE